MFKLLKKITFLQVFSKTTYLYLRELFILYLCISIWIVSIILYTSLVFKPFNDFQLIFVFYRILFEIFLQLFEYFSYFMFIFCLMHFLIEIHDFNDVLFCISTMVITFNVFVYCLQYWRKLCPKILFKITSIQLLLKNVLFWSCMLNLVIFDFFMEQLNQCVTLKID